MTHTQPRHFERLDRGSQNELINEFVAIRAAQRPKSTLQGIQADDLRAGTRVKYSAAGVQPDSSTADNMRRSPVGQRASAQTLPSVPGYCRSIRLSSSIENFSRPAPWSPISPTSPTPRMSSRDVVDGSHLLIENTSKSALKTCAISGQDLQGGMNSALHTRVHVDDVLLAVTHAITTVDGSAEPMGISAPPMSSRSMKPAITVDASTQAENHVAANLGSLTSPPLRHAYSFPTAKIISQHDHHCLANDDQHATEARPDSIQPMTTGQWEDFVDYSYEQAAEADCNFDWSQRTVYVDRDLESTGVPASEGHPVKELVSCKVEEPQCPETRESKPYPGPLRPGHVLAANEIDPQHTLKKSVTELEDCLSPFGRHQSSSEFVGYQHLPQLSSKSPSDVHVPSNPRCTDHDAYLQIPPCDCVEPELGVGQSVTCERCSSRESGSFRGLRPLLNKYSSDGSLLSRTSSTIRTFRSSNSVGSLPELIYSPEGARCERTSSTFASSSGRHPISTHLSTASLSQMQLDIPTVDRQEGPLSTHVNPLGDAVSDISRTSATCPDKLPEATAEPSGKPEPADMSKANAKPLSTRKRSASAVTPGRCQPTRRYSLFPPQQSLDRRV